MTDDGRGKQANANIAAILLAAGQSKRYGPANKLLQNYGEKTLIEQALAPLLSLGLGEILIITGHQAEDIRQQLTPLSTAHPEIRFVHNPHYREGMGTSLAAGAAALSQGIDACFICLADMPDLTSEIYRQLLTARPKSEAAILAPSYQGKRGHPVLFTSTYFNELKTLTGDQGARHVITRHKAHLHLIPLNTPIILQDIDQPQDITRTTPF